MAPCAVYLLSFTLILSLLPAPALAQAPAWDGRLGPPGVDGGGWEWFLDPISGVVQYYDSTVINTIAAAGDELFVGGRFSTAGGSPARSIARWSGAGGGWAPLGAGVNGTVNAIVIKGDTVFVGGAFSQAGGAAASNIARWDRASGRWFPLGEGLDGGVRALALIDGLLYVGGSFAGYLARWDGQGWEAPSGETDGVVQTLAAGPGGALYAGGFFRTIDGVAANRIARWDGTSWAPLGGGMNGSRENVNVIVPLGEDLYVGGDFGDAGGATGTRNLARWSIGTERWSALGGGVSAEVDSIAVAGGSVYVGGAFRQAGGLEIRRLARWSIGAEAWSPVGGGLDGSAEVLLAAGGALYAGGLFTWAGDTAAHHIARFDPSTSAWGGLGPGAAGGGLNNIVYEVATDGDAVYVAGLFTARGQQPLSHIARYQPATDSWAQLAGGIDSQINTPRLSSFADAIAVDGGSIYVGGLFTSVGDQDPPLIARNVARYDRAAGRWAALGDGVIGAVYDLALGPGGRLYAGGAFDRADGRPAARIAAWDGASWSPLGAGLSGDANAAVNALAVSGATLYAGGQFTQAGGVAANGLARWDGQGWAAVDPSFRGRVSALALRGSTLFVGGRFTAGGLSDPTYIAAYDLAQRRWAALGGGVNGPVTSIALDGAALYAGGSFTLAGGVAASNIARWDGQSWAALGGGAAGGHLSQGSEVIALAAGPTGLYAGGRFTGAGGRPAAHFARYAAGAPGFAPSERLFLPLMRSR